MENKYTNPYIVLGGESPDPDVRERAVKLKGEIDIKGFFDIIALTLLAEPISQNLKGAISDICDYFLKKYADLNIENIRIPNQYFLLSAIGNEIYVRAAGIKKGSVASSSPTGFVIVSKMPALELRKNFGFDEGFEASIQDYCAASLFAHEIYHGIPQAIFNSNKPNNNSNGYSHRRGLVYITKNDLRGDTLEEGVASIEQSMVEETIIRKHFPKVAILSKQIRLRTQSKCRTLGADIPYEAIFVDENSFRNENIFYVSCPDSIILTRFLEKNIDDFFPTVERARVEGKTLTLAKKIESKFGKGSYREIVTADDTNAKAVLEKLKLLVR